MHSPEEERDMNLLEEMGYEPTDVPAADAPKHFIAFFGFAFICAVTAWVFMSVVDRTSTTEKTEADIARRVMPPTGTPLLQSNSSAKMDMQELRKIEYVKSHTLSWVDESKGPK